MSQLRTASAGRRTPARSAAGAPATPGVRTGFVIAAILAGQLQNILQSVVPGAGAVTLLDDVLVLIALALSLRFVPRLKGIAPPVLIVWMIVCGLALVLSLAFSPFSAGSQFALFRQILVPALLMLIGLTLQPSEWRRIAFLTIGLAVINAVYIVIEIAVAPLIDPKIFARVSGYTIYGDGYPSTYHGNDVLTGERVIRAGGLLLNPPIMGLFIGIAVVLAFYMIKRPWMRWTTTVLLLIALYETNARGGILLAAIGLGAGFLIRWIGPWLATTLIVAAG
ncbi:MAG: hypothetical protein K0S37_4238, partial [Microbacterium sp.]|nr:hypothetical protein [Microbacterium sp.]